MLKSTVNILKPHLQERRKRGEDNMEAFLADIYAHQGNFSEAGRLYKKTGYDQKALNMYTDLRMFELAKVGMIVF